VLLERYLEKRYTKTDDAARRAFEALLALPDPQLLAYLMGYSRPADAETARVVDAIAKPD
jgi:succinate dehydrogenase flavin-adding protein (antitoxin of CptAB toxin-antitoxin module)